MMAAILKVVKWTYKIPEIVKLPRRKINMDLNCIFSTAPPLTAAANCNNSYSRPWSWSDANNDELSLNKVTQWADPDHQRLPHSGGLTGSKCGLMTTKYNQAKQWYPIPHSSISIIQNLRMKTSTWEISPDLEGFDVASALWFVLVSGMSWEPVCGKLWVLMWRHGRGPGPRCPGGLWFSDISELPHSLHSCSHSDHDQWSIVFLLIIVLGDIQDAVWWPLPDVISPPRVRHVPVCPRWVQGTGVQTSEASAISCVPDQSVVTSPCPGPATARAQCAARLWAEHTCSQW